MSRRWAAYTAVIVCLALNVPFMVAALSRYPQDLRWGSAEGAYTLLLFGGYYVFLIYVLLTLVVLSARGRDSTRGQHDILTLARLLRALTASCIAYEGAIDAFWLQHLLTTFGRVGIGRQTARASSPPP